MCGLPFHLFFHGLCSTGQIIYFFKFFGINKICLDILSYLDTSIQTVSIILGNNIYIVQMFHLILFQFISR